MEFNLDFSSEWKRLVSLPLRHVERAGEPFRKLYKILKGRRFYHEPDRLRIYFVKQWLQVPFSLWPADFAGIGEHIAREIAEGRSLDDHMAFMLDGLERYPLPSAQEIVAEEERLAEAGDYTRFLQNPVKFEAKQAELISNMELQRRWRRFKELFNVEKYRGPDGLNRRTMLTERNERSDSWKFNPDDDRSIYQTALDLLCQEFDLLGFEGDRPLLLKPTVTVTAYGTMIVIPKYMSYDHRRDFVTRALKRAHNVHAPMRQGNKWSISRQHKNMKAARTYLYDYKAQKAGLAGEVRRQFVIEHAQLHPGTSTREIRRLSRIGEGLFGLE